MAPSRKATVVSGFDIVRTIRRKEGDAPPSAPPPERPGGSVALPPRRQVACPQCGWETQISGRPTFGVCPKCRRKFDIVDYTLDTEFQGRIETGGAVRLAAGARVFQGEISAAEVEIEGRVESGRVVAWRRLTLRPGAACDPRLLQFRDLEVAEGAHLEWEGAVACRNLDVAGQVAGEFDVQQRVRLRSSGRLQGRLRCRALQVEEGAGLLADVVAGPDAASPAG